ncbi:MAG: hypothetical protein L3J83_09570, partial [Proteobacteria bacterium]|nr:hypothetical protein [Pseudomonadota bacterium]
MDKFTTIFIGLVLPFIAFANNSALNHSELELKILNELQAENIIDQQQFKHLKSQALERAPLQKLKALGGTATINGHVQNTSAMSLDMHFLTLYELVAGDKVFVDSINTDVIGNYSFTGLTAGTYLIYSGSASDDYLDYQWDSTGNTVCTIFSCPDNPTSQ